MSVGKGSRGQRGRYRRRWPSQWLRWGAWLVALVPISLCGVAAAGQSGTDRTLKPALEGAPAETSPAESPSGHYYALIIGIGDYPPPVPKLKNPAPDALAIGEVLTKDYGFKVTALMDGQATRNNILKELTRYRNTLFKQDSLLIYYAGHGARDTDQEGGRSAYWIPVDADSKESPNSISSSDLAVRLREMLAGHVLVIADSCYAGDMTRDVREAVSAEDLTLPKRMLQITSRNLMASGNDEPVMDSGGSGHSVFARELLEGLQGASGTMFTGTQLFIDKVQSGVIGRAEQTPIYDPFPGAGDGGGDFVFVRTGMASPVIASNKVVAAPSRSVQAPPPVPAWTPPPQGVTPQLMGYSIDLLAIRDNPELLDRLLPGFTREQIGVEQRIWQSLDLMENASSGDGAANLILNPKKPAFVFEWQKLIDTRPELARGPVLDAF